MAIKKKAINEEDYGEAPRVIDDRPFYSFILEHLTLCLITLI